MENSNLTIIGAGSGTAGGVIKGCLLSIDSISAASVMEVMVYAVFSALAGIATKMLIDRITESLRPTAPKKSRGKDADEYINEIYNKYN